MINKNWDEEGFYKGLRILHYDDEGVYIKRKMLEYFVVDSIFDWTGMIFRIVKEPIRNGQPQ